MPFSPDVAGLVVAAIFSLMVWSTARDNRQGDERYWKLDAERREFQSRDRSRRFDQYAYSPGIFTTTTSVWMGHVRH